MASLLETRSLLISALPWAQDLPSLTALSLPNLLLWGRYRRLMRSESGGWGVAAVNLVLVLMNCRRKCLFQRFSTPSHSVAPFCHPHKHQPGLQGSFRALSLVAKPHFICLCPRPTSCIHARAHPKNLNKPLFSSDLYSQRGMQPHCAQALTITCLLSQISLFIP